MLQGARWAAVLLAPVLAVSQLSNNSVTVTASQAASQQPDQAVFGVNVVSGLDKNLSDIVGVLQGSGITAGNFVGVSSAVLLAVLAPTPPAPNPAPQIQWNFQLTVPIAQLKATTTALAALAQSIPQNNSGLSLTFAVQGTQVSAQQTAGCSFSDLLSQARAKAQQLTNAGGSSAGLTVGLIQALTTSTPAACSLTVRFALGTVLMPSQPYSITVTASRPISAQPDEVSISLNATADVNSGLDDITAALQQAGIAGATFTGVNTVTVYGGLPAATKSQLQWSFNLTAPLAKIKDTFTALFAAQQALAKGAPRINVSFFGGQTAMSPQLAHSLTCPDADLFKDAQTAAQQVAAAAGASAGAVLSISGGNVPSGVTTIASTIYDPVTSGGYFYLGGGGYASFLLGVPGFAPNCSMTVAFQLVQ
jgi:hypothetical protein